MEQTSIQTLGNKDLYDFLINCPKNFHENERIRKFQLKNGDYIHCILWNYHFYITGTDIVKILIWRFQNAGRNIGAIKKFEEGIFSDLRNLKPGVDATLEGPRSKFLEFLYKNGCIRTQKKQKVFYWYSVPHDELFFDALERDIRRVSSIYAYNRIAQDPQNLILSEGNPTDSYSKFHGSGILSSSSMFSKSLFNNQNNNKIIENNKLDSNMNSNEVFNINDVLFGSTKTTPPSKIYNNIPEGLKMGEYNKNNINIQNTDLFGNDIQYGNYNVNLRKRKSTDYYKSNMNKNYSIDKDLFSSSFFNNQNPNGDLNGLYDIMGNDNNIKNSKDYITESQSAIKEKNSTVKGLDFDDFDLGEFNFLKERCKEHFSHKNDNCVLKILDDKNKDEKIKSIDRMSEIRFVGSKERN